MATAESVPTTPAEHATTSSWTMTMRTSGNSIMYWKSGLAMPPFSHTVVAYNQQKPRLASGKRIP